MNKYIEVPVCTESELFEHTEIVCTIPHFERSVKYTVGAIMRYNDGKFYKKITSDSNISTNWGEAPDDEWAVGHWVLYHDPVETESVEPSNYVGCWNNAINWQPGDFCINGGNVWKCVSAVYASLGEWYVPGNPRRNHEMCWDGIVNQTEPVMSEPVTVLNIPPLLFKHYIKVADDGTIIDGFSSAFRLPDESHICINERGGYQFRLYPDGDENPMLKNRNGVFLYRFVDGDIVARPLVDVQSETHAVLAKLVSVEERLDVMMAALSEMGGVVYG